MFKNIHKRLCCLFAILILLSTTGCQSTQPGTNSDGYLELVDSPSTTLNNVWYNPGGIFRCAIFESLLLPDAEMKEFKGALAEKYHISDDGLTYAFQLRENVTWHDGEVFDAEDVLFSVKAALRSDKLHGLLQSTLFYIQGAETYSTGTSDDLPGIDIADSQIIFHLTTPVSDFLDGMAQFAILPEHLLGETNPNEISSSDYWKKPIGCGCYKVTEAVEGEHFILEANPDYYGEKPGIRKIRLRTNVADCVQEMQAGTLDFYVTNDPEEIALLKGISDCSEHRLNILFPAYLIMNLSEDEGTNAYLKDVRVRKALLMAINRESIVDAIFPGSAVTNTLVPSWDSMYWSDGDEYIFDPEEASRLLKEAGFDFEQTLRLRYSTKGQSTADLMNAIAVHWRAIGVKVDLEKFDGSGSEHMFNIRDFDICYKRLSAFDHTSIYEEVHGDGIMQENLFNQPVYDEYLEQLEITQNTDSKKSLIQQMQILDQQYLLRLPLFALANIAYVNESHFHMPEAYGNLWYRYDLHFSDWKLVNK